MHGLAEDPEGVRRDEHSEELFRNVIRIADVHRGAAVTGQVLNRLRLRFQVLVVRVRDAHAAVFLEVTAVDVQDLRRVRIRQTAEEHRVHQGEDGVVDADAEPEGDDRQEGKPSVLDQHAHGEAEVLQEGHTGVIRRQT